MKPNRPLIAASVLALVALTGVNLRADGDGDGNGPDTMSIRPNHKHQIHGAPRNGAPSNGSVVTGNGINYNGGPVMNPVNLYFILYGNWSGQDSTGPAILERWAQTIAPSSYFAINTTYGDSTGNSVPNAVTFKGVYTDTGSLGTNLSDASIGQLTTNAINSGQFGTAGVPDPNGLYMVLTAPGVGESSGFLTQYCGWHWSGSFYDGAVQEGYIYSGTTVVKFAFIGNAAGPSFGACAVQSNSPNGDAGADAMISVMAHELSETATDPEGNAWYVVGGPTNGEEMADLCAWNFGTTFAAPNGSAANVTLSGYNYLMQQLWLNANGGKCALSYTSTPDFSVGISSSQTVAQGTTSGNYTATATPSGGFTGTVTWSYGSTPGITVTPTSALTGNTFTFDLTPASNLAPGTYTVAITGTSSTLVHSVNATIVVTAPNFNVSVSGSQTVAPGGTTASNYTLTATPVNGFNGTVAWAFGTLPTGITATPSNLATGNTSTFKLTAASNVTPATYSIPITATSGSISHSLNATLVVSAPAATFTLSITPSSQTVTHPSSGKTATATYTINVTSTGGFANPVHLSVSGGVTGVTPAITGTNPVTPGGSSTLTVTVSNSAKTGSQTQSFVVTGSATGTTNKTASATLTY